MGGADSEVRADRRASCFESGLVQPRLVRATSKRLGLRPKPRCASSAAPTPPLQAPPWRAPARCSRSSAPGTPDGTMVDAIARPHVPRVMSGDPRAHRSAARHAGARRPRSSASSARSASRLPPTAPRRPGSVTVPGWRPDVARAGRRHRGSGTASRLRTPAGHLPAGAPGAAARPTRALRATRACGRPCSAWASRKRSALRSSKPARPRRLPAVAPLDHAGQSARRRPLR